MKPKILVSACLLGEPVRYNGTGANTIQPILQQWRDQDRLIAVCPEILAGMSIPRPPAEIQGQNSGTGVLTGNARVIEATGNDVTELFIKGAQKVLEVVKNHNIKIAIMKARSPSCGSLQTYDGSFSSKCIAGQGVTSALLLQHGCQVFNEEQLQEAKAAYDQLLDSL